MFAVRVEVQCDEGFVAWDFSANDAGTELYHDDKDSDYALDMSCTVTAVRDRREKLFFFTALRVNDATVWY